MVERAELARASAGSERVVIVKEEVDFVKNVWRGFAFTLGTVLAFTLLAVVFGRRW